MPSLSYLGHSLKYLGGVAAWHLAFICPVLAQVTSDNTLPLGSLVTTNGNVITIQGGSLAGGNLFHSFEQFSILTGKTAIFESTPTIQNIISRVTGGSVSTIDGLIQAGNTANLFLINPNGIVLGPNASLAIGGSFVASTANSIRFADNTEFSASNPQPLLTVSAPVGLVFGNTPGAIRVQADTVVPGGVTATETADAGQLLNTAQNTQPSTPGSYVSRIVGTIASETDRADLYKIYYDGQQPFSATTLRNTDFNTQLFLFDANGRGIYGNDDLESISRSALPPNHPRTPTTPGTYYLAVSGSNSDPISTGGEIFSGTPTSVLTPTAGAGALPLSSWNRDPRRLGSYTVNLFGVQTGSLQVQPGKTLALVGGPIQLEGGQLQAQGGQLEIGGVTGPGEVKLTTVDGTLRLNFPQEIPRANVSITDSSLLNVASSGGRGGVNLYAENFTLKNSVITAGLSAGSLPGTQAGNILINTTGEAAFLDISTVRNSIASNASGQGGNIDIQARSLRANNGSEIRAITFGQGNTGNIVVRANSVNLEGSSGLASTQIATQVTSSAIGNAGDLDLRTDQLLVTQGAQLGTNSFGQGNSGNINLQVSGAATFDGVGGNRNSSGAFTQAASSTMGNSGNLTISASTLSVLNGAQLSTSTFGKGNAGDLTIQATGAVEFVGGVRIGASTIRSSGAFTSVDSSLTPLPIGNGGDLRIAARELTVSQGALLNASTAGQGAAGTINIVTSGPVVFSGVNENNQAGGAFAAVTSRGLGNGGSLNIQSDSLSLSGGSLLATNTFGAGNAGNITLRVADRLFVDGTSNNGSSSSIVTSVESFKDTKGVEVAAIGDGGSINIQTGTLNLVNGGQLAASTRGGGNAGNIQVTARDEVRLEQEGAIISRVEPEGKGNSGTIALTVGTPSLVGDLLLLEGGQLLTSTRGQGNAGDIVLSVSGTVVFDGFSANGIFSSAGSSVAAGATGDGGNLYLTAQNLTFTNGGRLDSSTLGNGNAGDIKLQISDRAVLSGKGIGNRPSGILSFLFAGAIGKGGMIDLTAGSLQVDQGAQITSSTGGQGNAGDVKLQVQDQLLFDGGILSTSVVVGGVGQAGSIDLTGRSLLISNGGQILSETGGVGNAGSVLITTRETTIYGTDAQNFPSIVLTKVEPTAQGNGGNIGITTGALVLSNGGRLSASTAGQGNGGNITLQADTLLLDGISANGSFSSGVFSAVETTGVGQGGTIEITAAESLTVQQGAGLSASVAGQGNGGNITIRAGEALFTGSGGNGNPSSASTAVTAGSIGQGGTLSVEGRSLTLTDGAAFSTSLAGRGQGGDLRLQLVDQVVVADSGLFSLVQETGVGPGGNIEISGRNLTLRGSTTVATQTFGQGTAGKITFQAREQFVFDGQGAGDRFSGASSAAFVGSTGDGGNIEVTAQNFSLLNGAGLYASTASQGRAGDITLQVSDRVLLSGLGSSGLNSGLFSQVTNVGRGAGGNIEVNGRSVVLNAGAVLSVETAGTGQAGNIQVQAAEQLTLTGVQTGFFASTAPNSTGNGGNISVDPPQVMITDGAGISVNSQGSGNAGSIDLQAGTLTLAKNAFLTAATASGEGGNITLQVQDNLILRNHSLISATAGGTGKGGNLDIRAGFVVAVPGENSDIIANAFQGQGGNIQITAQGILGLEYRPQLTPANDITASSQFGVDGVVTIDTPGIDPSRGLVTLPSDVVNASGLISQGCGSSPISGRFVVTGKGGLPASPGETLNPSDTLLADWVTIPNDQKETAYSPSNQMAEPAAPVLAALPVTAAVWQIDQQGKVTLLAEASTVTAVTPTIPASTCMAR